MRRDGRPGRSVKKTGGCPSGKVRWKDHKQAAAAVRTIRSHYGTASSRGDDRALRLYECDMCDGWHATSQYAD